MQGTSTERVRKHQRGIKTDLRELLATQAEMREQQCEMREQLSEVLSILARQHRQNGHDRADPR